MPSVHLNTFLILYDIHCYKATHTEKETWGRGTSPFDSSLGMHEKYENPTAAKSDYAAILVSKSSSPFVRNALFFLF